MLRRSAETECWDGILKEYWYGVLIRRTETEYWDRVLRKGAETVLRQCRDGVLRQKCNDLLKSKIELVSNISGSENVLAMLCIGRKWTAKMILRPVCRRQCSQQLENWPFCNVCIALHSLAQKQLRLRSFRGQQKSQAWFAVHASGPILIFGTHWRRQWWANSRMFFFYQKAHPF